MSKEEKFQFDIANLKKDLAMEMKKTSGDVITKLMDLGIMATINKDLDFDTAFLIASEFGITAEKEVVVTEEQYSLAIGRRGQNVKLASQLVNADIDILTEEQERERRAI